MLKVFSALAAICCCAPASASDWEDCTSRMKLYLEAEVTEPNPIDHMLDFALDIGRSHLGTKEHRERAHIAHDNTVAQIVELADSIEAFCDSLKED